MTALWMAVIVPPHARLDGSGSGWECDRGWREEDEGCVAVAVPLHHDQRLVPPVVYLRQHGQVAQRQRRGQQLQGVSGLGSGDPLPAGSGQPRLHGVERPGVLHGEGVAGGTAQVVAGGGQAAPILLPSVVHRPGQGRGLHAEGRDLRVDRGE